jgi:hypothetical protein
MKNNIYMINLHFLQHNKKKNNFNYWFSSLAQNHQIYLKDSLTYDFTKMYSNQSLSIEIKEIEKIDEEIEKIQLDIDKNKNIIEVQVLPIEQPIIQKIDNLTQNLETNINFTNFQVYNDYIFWIYIENIDNVDLFYGVELDKDKNFETYVDFIKELNTKLLTYDLDGRLKLEFILNGNRLTLKYTNNTNSNFTIIGLDDATVNPYNKDGDYIENRNLITFKQFYKLNDKVENNSGLTNIMRKFRTMRIINSNDTNRVKTIFIDTISIGLNENKYDYQGELRRIRGFSRTAQGNELRSSIKDLEKNKTELNRKKNRLVNGIELLKNNINDSKCIMYNSHIRKVLEKLNVFEFTTLYMIEIYDSDYINNDKEIVAKLLYTYLNFDVDNYLYTSSLINYLLIHKNSNTDSILDVINNYSITYDEIQNVYTLLDITNTMSIPEIINSVIDNIVKLNNNLTSLNTQINQKQSEFTNIQQESYISTFDILGEELQRRFQTLSNLQVEIANLRNEIATIERKMNIIKENIYTLVFLGQDNIYSKEHYDKRYVTNTYTNFLNDHNTHYVFNPSSFNTERDIDYMNVPEINNENIESVNENLLYYTELYIKNSNINNTIPLRLSSSTTKDNKIYFDFVNKVDKVDNLDIYDIVRSTDRNYYNIRFVVPRIRPMFTLINLKKYYSSFFVDILETYNINSKESNVEGAFTDLILNPDQNDNTIKVVANNDINIKTDVNVDIDDEKIRIEFTNLHYNMKIGYVYNNVFLNVSQLYSISEKKFFTGVYINEETLYKSVQKWKVPYDIIYNMFYNRLKYTTILDDEINYIESFDNNRNIGLVILNFIIDIIIEIIIETILSAIVKKFWNGLLNVKSINIKCNKR